MADPVAHLTASNVSIWLDDLSRDLLDGGELERLVSERGVVGVTTNPAIFASALARGDRYTDQLSRLAASGAGVADAVLAVTTEDVRRAADLLAPVYAATGGADGRVSIEVDPRLARDPAATIAAARGLYDAVNRTNVLIKIPATEQGLPAITAVTAAGVGVNATLIFSVQRYHDVIDAYLTGLEQARGVGLPLSGIRSVASFFVSRLDVEIDARLDALGTDRAHGLRGRTALANARLACRRQREVLAGERWAGLAADGAHPQRPLWASTAVTDPAYADTRYVDGLVLAGTVTTMPVRTLEAYAAHGTANPSVADAADDDALFRSLRELGVDYDAVVQKLEADGLRRLEANWDDLNDTVEHELLMAGAAGPRVPA